MVVALLLVPLFPLPGAESVGETLPLTLAAGGHGTQGPGTAVAWDGFNAYVFGPCMPAGCDETVVVRFRPNEMTATVLEATIPGSRTGAGVAWDGTRLHMLGGVTPQGAVVNEVVHYDPRATGSSFTVEPFPKNLTPRHGAAVAWMGTRDNHFCAEGCMVVAGGKGANGYLNDLRVYNPTQGVAYPNNMSGVTFLAYSAVAHDPGSWDDATCRRGCVYLFGGENEAGRSRQILRVDLYEGKATQMSALLPSARAHATAVWAGGGAYVFGGETGDRQYTDEVLWYDAERDAITKVTGIPFDPLRGASAVWAEGSAYVLAGQKGGCSPTCFPSLSRITKVSPRAPDAPASAKVETGLAPGTHVITWTPPASTNGAPVTIYRLYRGDSLIANTSRTSWTHAGCAAAETCTYKVTAANAFGEGPARPAGSAVGHAAVPSPPRNVQIVGTGADGNWPWLTWDDPAFSGGASAYEWALYSTNLEGNAAPKRLETFRMGSSGPYSRNISNYANFVGQEYFSLAAIGQHVTGPVEGDRSRVAALVPNAPPGFQATGGWSGGAPVVALSWQAATVPQGIPVQRYLVHRSTEPGFAPGDDNLLADVGLSLAHTDAAVASGVVYHYKVVAENSRNKGMPSGEASAIGHAPPTAPRSLVAEGGAKQVKLSWKGPEDTGGPAPTAYRVYRDDGGAPLAQVAGSVHAFTDAGLPNGATFRYRVSVVTPVGESPLSAEASATTAVPPSAPQDFAAVAWDSGRIHLTWSPPLDDGGDAVTAYKVHLNGTHLATVTGCATTCSYTQANRAAGVTYTYAVSAVNGAGEGTLADPIQIEGTGTVPGPVALTIQQRLQEGDVLLSWGAPNPIGNAQSVLHYRIERHNGNGTFETVHELDASLFGTKTWQDEHVCAGVTYTYRVFATNHFGEGPASNEASAMGTDVCTGDQPPMELE